MRLLLLIYSLLLLACSREAWRAPMALPAGADSSARSVWAGAGKVKFSGPVTIQVGGSNNSASAADNTKAGQRGGAAATAPNSAATNSTKKSSGSLWWLYLVAMLVGAAGWEYIRAKLPTKWLPWLVGAG